MSADLERRCARFEAECRRRGLRVTAQRLAVYRALAEDPTHLTADSVYARLRVGMTGLSLATVYRILESLERGGFVRRVSTTDGIGRFDANLTPHQHLVCRRCGRIVDSEVAAFARLRLPQCSVDFVPETFDIRIVGTCRRCRRPGGRRTKSI
ncbi:MAG: transcriptional repressor [Acidobacteriia bacterium]|nr:transcriptional repressor [Terriglobia bacterium]